MGHNRLMYVFPHSWVEKNTRLFICFRIKELLPSKIPKCREKWMTAIYFIGKSLKIYKVQIYIYIRALRSPWLQEGGYSRDQIFNADETG